MLWRQGDIYIETAESVPATAVERPDGVLADGEVTGHCHRIENFKTAILYEDRGQLFMVVVSPKARIVHDEHQPIDLDRGTYRVWRQREYDPMQRAFSHVVSD